ncbi:speriolin-like [Sphaerodactylus townsendi]|uniref:speriolin-like n=1 Tax=Sphaerodactylus townsendi TaxID=933632 RepID=UPI00202763A0|nr:speriolin-like [Sphaerodactylus townsendi]
MRRDAGPYFAAPKAPEVVPKSHRGADRQAMSIRVGTSKPPKESKNATMQRIVGEIAFQLDRRILSVIFPDRVRLYGFNVRDIPDKLAQSASDSQSGLTNEQRASYLERYKNLSARLKPLGYDPNIHPSFIEHIVNTYGILRERPDSTGFEADAYNSVEYLRSVVQQMVPEENRADCMMLLNCLHLLSQDDGKPMFIW